MDQVCASSAQLTVLITSSKFRSYEAGMPTSILEGELTTESPGVQDNVWGSEPLIQKTTTRKLGPKFSSIRFKARLRDQALYFPAFYLLQIYVALPRRQLRTIKPQAAIRKYHRV